MQKILAVIPARKNSKRIKNKNLKNFCGIPLIEHTIKAAKNSMMLNDIMVTTDSQEISAIAEKYSIFVNQRPPSLCEDEVTTISVLQYLHSKYPEYEHFVTLQPTNPLRKSAQIDLAIKKYLDEHLDSLSTVHVTRDHPYLTGKLGSNASMEKFMRSNAIGKRSQELPKVYTLNGAIYINRCNLLKINKSLIYPINSGALILDWISGIDIDTMDDFKLAEILKSAEK
jgi:CMP-N-acetylneuraminic acid synthetase